MTQPHHDRGSSQQATLRQPAHHEPRACVQCAKAKARCFMDPAISPTRCVRCHRLRKECTPRGPADVARPQVSRSSPSIQVASVADPSDRFSKLEEKIDMLARMVALQSSNTSSSGRSAQDDASSNGLSTTETPSSASLHDHGSPVGGSSVNFFDRYLRVHFPFVGHPKVQVDYFANQRPCLHAALSMACAFDNRPEQLRRGLNLTQRLADVIIVQGEKSFDALQALLVHIGWYHGHLKGRSRIVPLLQMVHALISDLGLNKMPHQNDRRQLIFDNCRTSYGFSDGVNKHERSLDEKRAVLGFFYFSSAISVLFKRLDAVKYSVYMQQFSDDLAESPDASDKYLLRLVKAQAVMEQISQVIPLDDFNSPDYQPGSPSLKLHIDMLAESVGALDDTFLGAEEDQNISLLLHKQIAAIYLTESGLYDRAWKSNATANTERVAVLYASLRAVQAYFSTFVRLRPDYMITTAYPTWAQLAYAMLICSRLCLLSCPGWNIAEVREAIEFPATLDSVRDKLLHASSFASTGSLPWHFGPSPKQADDMMTTTAAKVVRIKVWYEDHISRPSGRTIGTDMAGDAPITGDGVAAVAPLDESFWLEFLNTSQIMDEFNSISS